MPGFGPEDINFESEKKETNKINGVDLSELLVDKIYFKGAIIFTLFLIAYSYFVLPIYNFKYDVSILTMTIITLIYLFLLVKNKKIVTKIIPIFVIIYIGLVLYSSPIFNSDKYYDLIGDVTTTSYNESPPDIDNSKIPIVDEALAQTLGDKVLGNEIGLGSQFSVGEYYFINTADDIAWVAPLEPRSFIKWFQNKDGAPGYVYVSATNPNDVRLVQEIDGNPINLRYTNSAYFMKNIHRYAYFNGNMTRGLTDYSFEIDDDGNPFWVITVYAPQVGIKGYDATGIVVVDAQTGEIKNYNEQNEFPDWVERVHPTNFITQQINYWGAYKNGWFNTIFGQKEMITTTRGHSYVNIDDDPYYYTGLTSITNDQSTVGFILVNLRTKDVDFYPITGATELAAMSSAEGQVQQFGYRATFPILLNEFSMATYFMTLKDVDGLLKQYAFVSVENYNIVGVGSTLKEARANYYNELKNNDVIDKDDAESFAVNGTIERINSFGEDFYIKLVDDPELYRVSITAGPFLPITQVGDVVELGTSGDFGDYIDVITFVNSSLQ